MERWQIVVIVVLVYLVAGYMLGYFDDPIRGLIWPYHYASDFIKGWNS
jgi:hypothetical protein